MLALLLAKKGYQAVILEKYRLSSSEAVGASMMLFPNGLKVISSILPSLSTEIEGLSPPLAFLRDLKSDGTVLGGSNLPETWKQRYGEEARGVKRSQLTTLLKRAVDDAGIEVLDGWNLASLITNPDGTITATSSSNLPQTGDLVIGCDGIHSTTRSLVLSSHALSQTQQPATFTGLTQTGGFSPTPLSLKSEHGMRNWYGPDAHVIAYPTSEHTTSWAITRRSSTEEIETWHQMSASALAAYKASLLLEFTSWDEPVRNLISGAERIIKYGLYDRPALAAKHWVGKGELEGKVVLIGDAAHPTSPHLGQGANQALEDAWHLANLMPSAETYKAAVKYEATDGFGKKGLGDVFERFAEMRAKRTAELVKGARAVGERRVVDMERCEARDETLKVAWEDRDGVEGKWEGLLSEPFVV